MSGDALLTVTGMVGAMTLFAILLVLVMRGLVRPIADTTTFPRSSATAAYSMTYIISSHSPINLSMSLSDIFSCPCSSSRLICRPLHFFLIRKWDVAF